MANKRFLVRILGYLGAGILLGLGVSAGGTPGTVLTVAGLLLIVALLFTFRLR